MKRFWAITGLVLFGLFAAPLAGCGDGEECDCCDSNADCGFGLRCVELSGGHGKVCAEAGGISYCYSDCD